MRHTPLALALLISALASTAHAQSGRACGPVPSTMRAARIAERGEPSALRIGRIAVPTLAENEVLVRVHFASINPVDWKRQQSGNMKFPATPGGDFSGVVVARGSAVAQFACGDSVAGIADPNGKGGSYAEYVAAAENALVAKPSNYSMAEAAAYPTVTVAAWRFLVAAAAADSGERVLVHGGAGGVGTMVVQMAKSLGAHVTATASARNHEYLRQLGADAMIDYIATRFEDVARDIDVVVDAVGGETTSRSANVLRSGGRLVSPGGDVPVSLCAGQKFTCPNEGPWDIQQGLAYAAPLIAGGKLRVHIDSVYPFEAIVAAQEHNRTGRTRGKVVVDLSAADDAVLVPLHAYLEGHATGLERHFRRAFAHDALLVGLKDGQYRQWSALDYIAASSSGRAPADEALRRRAITSVTVTGRVATAVIELDYPDMRAHDHMTLLERDGEWRIVIKSYDATTPVTTGADRRQDF